MIKKGDRVDYHAVIDGDITSTGHMVREVLPMPNPYGVPVARITGKAHYVSLDALTLAQGEDDDQENS